jgi:hypothetical protein
MGKQSSIEFCPRDIRATQKEILELANLSEKQQKLALRVVKELLRRKT